MSRNPGTIELPAVGVAFAMSIAGIIAVFGLAALMSSVLGWPAAILVAMLAYLVLVTIGTLAWIGNGLA